MTPTQPASPDLSSNRLPGVRPDADTLRLSRDIEAFNTRHPEGTSIMPWNTYFDELVQRRPAGFSVATASAK